MAKAFTILHRILPENSQCYRRLMVLAAIALLSAFYGRYSLRADNSIATPPPEIKAIMDKAARGTPPTQEEQRKLQEWQNRVVQRVRNGDTGLQPDLSGAQKVGITVPPDIQQFLIKRLTARLPQRKSSSNCNSGNNELKRRRRKCAARITPAIATATTLAMLIKGLIGTA